MADVGRLAPGLVPYARYLLAVAEYNGLRVQVTSTLRTRGQQELLYQRYLQCRANNPGKATCLPAAVPGTSDHELGLAFDLVVNGDFNSSAQAALGRFWESIGGRWAGRADPVHFYVR